MRPIIFILFFFMTVQYVYALDRRMHVNIIPYKKQALTLRFARTGGGFMQYNSAGTAVSKTENDLHAFKLLYRNHLIKNLELAVEVPYVLSRGGELTDAKGQKSEVSYSGEFGDIAMQATYQIRDCRKDPAGLIVGAELKLANANEEDGIGTGGYGIIYRSALSKKLGAFQPYLQGIYTDSLDGDTDGVETNAGDSLLGGVGVKYRPVDVLRIDIKYFYEFVTSDKVGSNGRSPVKYDGHDIEGFRVKGELFFSENFFVEAGYERSKPEETKLEINGTVITRKPYYRDRVIIGCSYIW